MTDSSLNTARNERFMNFYIGEFRRLSTLLFAERSDALMEFYGDAFDRRPDCIRLISKPTSLHIVSPTNHMIWREAKFVLDSDLSEADGLDELWARLHELIGNERNKYALAAMAAAHTNARRQIIKCRSEIVEAIPECLALLDTQYPQARRFADGVIAETEQMIESVIKSYPNYTTLSKIS